MDTNNKKLKLANMLVAKPRDILIIAIALLALAMFLLVMKVTVGSNSLDRIERYQKELEHRGSR